MMRVTPARLMTETSVATSSGSGVLGRRQQFDSIAGFGCYPAAHMC
jgi:hypothetical protein